MEGTKYAQHNQSNNITGFILRQNAIDWDIIGDVVAQILGCHLQQVNQHILLP